MAERFFCPTIRATDWRSAVAQINNRNQLLTRMLNDIATGIGIPSGRLVQGTKIDGIAEGAEVNPADLAELDPTQDTKLDGVETGADVTGDHEAATIVSQGALATLSAIAAGIGVASVWRKIYDEALSSPASVITIGSLDGNTDGEWILEIMAKWAGAPAGSIRLTFNTDTGNNYGYEYIYVSGGTAGAGNTEGTNHWYLCSFTGINEVSWGRMRIYAKAGWDRLGLTHIVNECDGTNVGENVMLGNIWSNTGTNITQIVLSATTADAIATGTRVMLYKRVA